ncbi:MAG: glycerophosphodiester phosphodiesterase family protein [Pseudomonadales bacterium]|nr:glycerophosphodiester phosphodiesterase family protein [Pseudomonadales bacterium]
MTREHVIEIVCHRGANEYAPENTYASAERCIEWGVDYLEIDVNTSRDGVMYVFHGPDLERTTGVNAKIYELDSDDVDRLDCGSWFGPGFAGTRIPRLDEFLLWVDHRVKLFFDVKFADLPELVRLVEARGLVDECFFWFGRDKFARALHELAPHLALKINVNRPDQVAHARKEYGARIVEFSLANMSEAMAEACRASGVKSMILQRPFSISAYEAILTSGVDMVNLDHADRFLEVARRVSN